MATSDAKNLSTLLCVDADGGYDDQGDQLALKTDFSAPTDFSAVSSGDLFEESFFERYSTLSVLRFVSMNIHNFSS